MNDSRYQYNNQYGGYPQNGRMPKRRKKRRVWPFILLLVLLLAGAAAVFVLVKFAKIQRNDIPKEDLVINTNLDPAELKNMSGYTNIAFFGVDSREGSLSSGANSDTIMICSINNKTKEVKLASVYRDSYLDNTQGGFQKATEVYSLGGPQQSLNMLNKNLDLNLSDYITVDFQALVAAVDLLGGVDIELTEGEVKWLNGYLVEGREVVGKDTPDVPGPGMQHLNGMQALAYSRIRYIGLDYERTERQRKVLEQLMQKAKSTDPLTLNKAIDTVLPMVLTSLSNTELIKLATGISGYDIGETTGFPMDKDTADIPSAGDCVVPKNLASNVVQLHQFLFSGESYTPSSTVQEISNQIINNTGIQ